MSPSDRVEDRKGRWISSFTDMVMPGQLVREVGDHLRRTSRREKLSTCRAIATTSSCARLILGDVAFLASP